MTNSMMGISTGGTLLATFPAQMTVRQQPERSVLRTMNRNRGMRIDIVDQPVVVFVSMHRSRLLDKRRDLCFFRDRSAFVAATFVVQMARWRLFEIAVLGACNDDFRYRVHIPHFGIAVLLAEAQSRLLYEGICREFLNHFLCNCYCRPSADY